MNSTQQKFLNNLEQAVLDDHNENQEKHINAAFETLDDIDVYNNHNKRMIEKRMQN